jgi:hydroxyacyl-ACP dehydratase HTD2-like protein with hotdog domain
MTLIDQDIMGAIGQSETLGSVTVQPQDIRKYAIATGQTCPKYLAGIEAPPMFFMSLPWELTELSGLADDGLSNDELIPAFPLEKRMGGGMRVELIRPIVAGDTLSAERTLVDIFEKEGRSGPLIFYVTRIEIQDATGAVVVRNYDKRIVR